MNGPSEELKQRVRENQNKLKNMKEKTHINTYGDDDWATPIKEKELRLTFSEWVKKQLTVEEVEERLNKRKTNSEKQKESDSLFAKRHIARGTKW